MRLRDVLERKESVVYAGYTRREAVEMVCTQIEAECREDKHKDIQEKIEKIKEKKEGTECAKRTRLTPFVNLTQTTKINKCSTAVIVPNVGMAYIVANRLINKKMSDEINAGGYFVGDTADDFIVGLRYKKDTEEYEEAPCIGADIVIATTKGLVSVDDRKVAKKRVVMKTEEDIKITETRMKIEMGVYAFASGIETVYILDADIILMQNAKYIRDVMYIVREAKPTAGRALNLKYLTSGEEKRSCIVYTTAVVPEIYEAEGIGIQEGCSIVEKKRKRTTEKKKKVAVSVIPSRGGGIQSVYSSAKHHIDQIACTCDRVLVLVRDEEKMQELERSMRESALVSPAEVFFVSEHMTRNKIKEEIKRDKKRVWVVTERFVFYRRKRLETLLGPFGARKILSVGVPQVCILEDIVQHTKIESEEETEKGMYSAPIVILSTGRDRYMIKDIVGRDIVMEDEWQYLDVITKIARI